MVPMGDYVFLVGGFRCDNTVYCMNMAEKPLEGMVQWTTVPRVHQDNEPPIRRYGHTLTAIGPGRFLLFGGMKQGGYRGQVNDLWLMTLLHPVTPEQEEEEEEERRKKLQTEASKSGGDVEEQEEEGEDPGPMPPKMMSCSPFG